MVLYRADENQVLWTHWHLFMKQHGITHHSKQANMEI